MSQEFDPNLEGTGNSSPAEAGLYSVVRCIGPGAQADTFLCQDHRQSDRLVVRKVFHETFSGQNPDLVDGPFNHLATLWHPHLARVLDFGWEDGKAYLVSEYVDGKPLLEACQGAPLEQILFLMAQLLIALDYLFAQNVLHLDLKPQSILVTSTPGLGGARVQLVDYGLMPWLYPATRMESNTVGTAPYTAPEYAMRRVLDVRADLYSVGILLYTALARRLPFQSKSAVGLLQEQLQKDPPPLHTVVKGLPQKLSDFVQALLSRDPQSRPATPRAALLGLAEAAEHSFPFDQLNWPTPFSDPDDVFCYTDFLKLFRRIALQGGRWALTGEEGSGKSFLARWLQRLFWLNQKQVVFFKGRDIPLLQGDQMIHPSEPTYVIIDDADEGPVEAWLRSRPYQHVVAFGRRMPWAKKEQRWKPYELKPLELDQLGTFLKKDLMNIDPRVLQECMTRTQGQFQALVQHGRALWRQGMVQRVGVTYILNTEKYLKAASSLQADQMGSPFSSHPELPRRLLHLLNFVQVPLPISTLAAWTAGSEAEVFSALQPLVRDELVERRVWLGREYFQSCLAAGAYHDAALDEAEVKKWIQGLWEEAWYRDALGAFERFFSPEALQNPELVLLKVRLFSGAGQHAEVLGLITAPFVNTLNPQQKCEAFESLGKALLFTGKIKQADAAFRNSYKQYQQSQDHEGQARILMNLGILSSQTGEQEKAVQFFQQAYQEAEKVEKKVPLTAVIDLQVANLYAAATDFDHAEPRFQSCLQILEALHKEDLLAQAYLNYATMNLNQGDLERAEYYSREGLILALFKRDRLTQGRFFLLSAKIEERHNNPAGILEKLSSAVETLSQAPLGVYHLQALVERAYFYEANRQLILAKQDAEDALQKARRIKEPDFEGQAHLVLGKMLRRDSDRLEGAVEHLDLARQHFAAAHNILRGWECEYERGEIERMRDNREQARAFFEQAHKMLEQALVQVPDGSPEAALLNQKKMQLEMSMSHL